MHSPVKHPYSFGFSKSSALPHHPGKGVLDGRHTPYQSHMRGEREREGENVSFRPDADKVTTFGEKWFSIPLSPHPRRAPSLYPVRVFQECQECAIIARTQTHVGPFGKGGNGEMVGGGGGVKRGALGEGAVFSFGG
ncbi:hypothetical protein CEXT_495471 [Caerostris extrusa]|uniref:Uncharacterized protein n=1 Tax=Caerostris extrusa TaxID=172846 RepID=A0AAV4Q515_CAEEX|nr:hypothetical protein CEXT_495471 [Caerostris extrusa]